MGKHTGKLTGKLWQAPRDLPRRAYAALARDARPYQASPRAPGYIYAKAVGSFVPKLTEKAFQKYGFSAATLLTDWAQIAGADVAGYTVPERLKWPRGAGAYAEVEEGAEGRPGATLVLRVDPARALDVEYKGRQIIERINAYFGYRAVAALRLIQAPVAATISAGRSSPSPGLPNDLLPRNKLGVASHGKPPSPQWGEGRGEGGNPADIGDDPLSRALARLGARVAGQAS